MLTSLKPMARHVSNHGFRKTISALKANLIAAIFFAFPFYALSSNAQGIGDAPLPPSHYIFDKNGVDLTSGTVNFQEPALLIGDAQSQMRYVRTSQTLGSAIHNYYGYISISGGQGTIYTVVVGDETHAFNVNTSNGTFSERYRTGESLNGQIYTSKDGTRYEFGVNDGGFPWPDGYIESEAYPRYHIYHGTGRDFVLRKITHPDGTIETLNYDFAQYVNAPKTARQRLQMYARLRSVVSSTGYHLHFNYFKNDLIGQGLAPSYWSVPTSVVLFNQSVDYCDQASASCPPLPHAWPSISFIYHNYANEPTGLPGTVTRQDVMGNSTIYTYAGTSGCVQGQVSGVRHAGYLMDDVVLSYSCVWSMNDNGFGMQPPTAISKVINKSISTNYSYTAREGIQYSGSVIMPSDITSATLTNSLSGNIFVDVLFEGNVETSASAHLPSTARDELNRATQFSYDSDFRISTQTLPSGAGFLYTYDARGNVIRITRSSEPNSGLPSIISTFGFDETCSNHLTCNKPNWVKDGNGNQTDYLYAPEHGGILSETRPADVNGVRAQKRYTYDRLTPMVLNASGIVESSPVWRLTRVSECLGATSTDPASCVGTSQEKVTSYAYNSNNLWLTSETVARGDGSNSQTTAYTYDVYGNQISSSNPNGYTSYATYDALRRKVYEIGMDPDGSGPLPRPIVHHVYDAFGNEVRTEVGTGFQIDGSDFSLSHYKQMIFDSVSGLLSQTREMVP